MSSEAEKAIRLPEVIPVDPVVTANTFDFKWNYEDVKAYLEKVTEKYTNLIVTDENLEDSQKAKRELVALRGRIKRFKSKWKPELQKPANAFSRQVDDLIRVVTEKEDALGVQLDVYEKKRREALYKEIQNEYWAAASMAGLDAARFDIEDKMQDKWFNKTQKWKDTCADIDAIVKAELAEQAAADAREDLLKSRIQIARMEVEKANEYYHLASPLRLEDVIHDTSELADISPDDTKSEIENAARTRHELEEAARAAKQEPVNEVAEPVNETVEEEPEAIPAEAPAAEDEEPADDMPPAPELPQSEEDGIATGAFPKRYVLWIDIECPSQDEAFQDIMRILKENGIHGHMRVEER